jgi:SET and MYND domain-containing protein
MAGSKALILKSSSSLFKIERHEGRGRCLVARTAIPKGRRIHPQDSEDWEALAPPVLHEGQRSTRCAYCFKTLYGPPHRFSNRKIIPQYTLLFCSTTCRDGGRRHGFEQEEQTVAQLYDEGSNNAPPTIFSTAILLYRILCVIHSEALRDSTTVRSQLDLLQHDDTSDDYDDDDKDNANFHHTQAVIATVVAMIQSSASSGMTLPPIDDLQKIATKIKRNGFSVCDGESVALGVGLYGTPCATNHSCKPNAIQTFLFGQQRLPTLLVTTSEHISSNHEICISYIDNSCPRWMRRERLQSDYRFWCTCDLCQNDKQESRIVGLRCTECKSGKRVMLVKSLAPSPQSYKCPTCGHDDFTRQLHILSSFVSQSGVSSLKDMEDVYARLRGLCFPDSWYVQEAGERVVQALLDLLGEQADNPSDQRKTASRALDILDELQVGEIYKPTSSVRSSILTYKAAKLRLFLLPDPRHAIVELQTVLKVLSVYYPKNHELIVGLQQSLIEAMM